MSVSQAMLSLRTYKGHITRAVNNIDTILSKPTLDKKSLQLAKEFLQSKWPGYEKAYNTLEAKLLEGGEEVEKEIEKAQNDYYEVWETYQAKVVECMEHIDSESNISKMKEHSAATSRPRLPAISLPVFSGEYTEYESFLDQFQSQVGSRADLEPVMKLQYLKSQLQGSALQLIQELSSTSDNYTNALDILKETYGDKERLKRAIFYKMMDLDSPHPTKSELEKFRVSMLNMTRSLANKHEYACCEWMVAAIFQRKLPSVTVRQLYLKYGNNFFTIDQLNEGIRDFVTHMEVEDLTKVNNKRSEAHISHQQAHKQREDTKEIGSYFSKGIKSSDKKTKANPKRNFNCVYCDKEHLASDCEFYNTLAKRRARLLELKRCTRCLSAKHEYSSCPTEIRMCNRCKKGNHHSALCCVDKGKARNPANNAQPHTTKETAQQTVLSVKGNTQTSSTALPTSTVIISDSNRRNKSNAEVRAFFDQGSQVSFIKRSLAEKLDLTICGHKELSVSGFLVTRDYERYDMVKVVVKLGNQRKRIIAVVMEDLPDKISIPGLCKTATKLRSRGVKLADKFIRSDLVEGIDVVVGSDYYGEFINGLTEIDNVKLCSSSGGYLIYGKIASDEMNKRQTTAVVARLCTEISPTEVSQMMEEEQIPIHKLWDLDTIGINPSKPAPEDCLTYRNYLDSVQYHDKQYWVRLPWKVDCPSLPNNYGMALGQLKSLTNSLKEDNNLNVYDEIIKSQVENGFIEKVDSADKNENTHYLPHHGVKKDSVTTPLRIVFNCSAKRKGSVSLNDCLMSGPSLTEKLGDTLLLFRQNKFAYTADISKAFLRVGLQESDRDYTRFLWYDNLPSEEPQMAMYRFKSVLFGATSSPFLLQATLDTHLRNSESAYKDIIRKGFYVDNYQGTTNSKEELQNIYNSANTEMSKANMPLRMWVTNDPELKLTIEEEFPEYKVPAETKILGLNWHVEQDTLSVKRPNLPTEQSPLTKRKLLSRVSTAFDPLGILTPITIKGKLLVREAWKMKIPWNEELPKHMKEEWRKLEEEWKELEEFKIPRIIGEVNENNDLHIFCDASTLAYGAVAYLVSKEKSVLVASKARVAPMKERTIPQMELTALQVGTHLGHYIFKTLTDLKIDNVHIWSDNTAALQWIKNDASKIPYVKNRVNDIRELASQYHFHHVPSKENPADLLSRGVTTTEMKTNPLWFHGPSWLRNPGKWPTKKEDVIRVNKITTEVMSKETAIFDASRFSSLAKILNITKLVFKFIKAVKSDAEEPDGLQYWIKNVQKECYKEEYKYLAEGNNSSYGLVKDLGLFLDHNRIIRCRGRLQNSELTEDSKFPILLPRKSWLTTLLITDTHKNVLHGGVADTLAELRTRFWIPKGRQVVKSILRTCLVCKVIEGRTLKQPGPPPLPKDRVVHIEPFHTVGVDYTGGITLSFTEDAIPRKYYICLFTCATSRAVHLELAKDMSAKTFLQLFRRFVARRSCPKTIISDNGSNFVSTSNFFKELYNEPLVRSHLETRAIEWKFIPPGAPWMGGFYERLIGVIKNCLRKSLYKSKVSEDDLRTILAEVELRVNNRPLTYVEDDVNMTPLTPSHLIHGRRLTTMPTDMENKNEDPDYVGKGASELNKGYQHLNKMLKRWEDVWRREYLTSLREKFYGAQNPSQEQKLKVGDIVIVEDDGPRTSWPLGKITKLFPDMNDISRKVEVFSKGAKYLRTLNKLIPLELHCTGETEKRKEIQTRKQPLRQAQQRARGAIKTLIDSQLV